MTHTLKIKEMYADRIMSGRKSFEVIKNDRDFQVDDIIQFHPVTNHNEMLTVYHEIYEKRYKIVYMHSGLGMKDNYVVLGIKEI